MVMKSHTEEQPGYGERSEVMKLKHKAYTIAIKELYVTYTQGHSRSILHLTENMAYKYVEKVR